MKNTLLNLLIVIILGACGVKGRPLPPDSPRDIGIGKPQYKGVDQELSKKKDADSSEEEKK